MYPRKLYSAWGLWPVWACQLLFITVGLCLLILYTLDIVGRSETSSSTKGQLAFLIACQFLTLMFCALEIVLWSYHLMDPWLYFSFQALGTIFWTVYTVLAYRVAPYYVWSQYGWAVEITILVILPFSCISLWVGLAYSIHLLVKMRKCGGRYGRVEEWHTPERISTSRHDRVPVREFRD